MGPDAARPVRPGKTIAKAAENARDGRHEKRPAFRPILISGENGFRRPISEERLRPVTTNFKGYLNRYAYEGETYSLRDLVSFDVTIAFVDSIEQLVVRQFDEDDVLIGESILVDEDDMAAFLIDEQAAYLKYYVDGSPRGRTLETGESVTFYIENGTPLVTVFELSLDADD